MRESLTTEIARAPIATLYSGGLNHTEADKIAQEKPPTLSRNETGTAFRTAGAIRA